MNDKLEFSKGASLQTKPPMNIVKHQKGYIRTLL